MLTPYTAIGRKMGGPELRAAIKDVPVYMIIPALQPSSSRHLLAAFLLAGGILPSVASAQTETPAVQAPAAEDQIGFAAAVVDYDSNTEIVTATGEVIVNRDGYTLRADKVVWNRTSGEVTAEGNIRSVGPEGDVAYGDKIVVTDTLKDGIVENLLVVLADESRLAAKRGF